MSRDSVAVLRDLLSKFADDMSHAAWVAFDRELDKLDAALTREAAPQALDVEVSWALHALGNPVENCEQAVTDQRIAALIRRLATPDSAIQSQQGATGGAVLRQFVEGLDCECDPDYSTQTCGRCQALAHPQAAGSAPANMVTVPASELRAMREEIEHLRARNAEQAERIVTLRETADRATGRADEAESKLSTLLDGIEGLPIAEFRGTEQSWKAGGQSIVTYRVLDQHFHAPMRAYIIDADDLKALREKANG